VRRPHDPALVAAELRETVLDYLRTTWALSDRELEATLFRSSKIPRPASSRVRTSTSVYPLRPNPRRAGPARHPPTYDPYLHQLQAWQRLSTRDGATPLATLVTTGTGSGKTECFLYPSSITAIAPSNE